MGTRQTLPFACGQRQHPTTHAADLRLDPRLPVPRQLHPQQLEPQQLELQQVGLRQVGLQ